MKNNTMGMYQGYTVEGSENIKMSTETMAGGAYCDMPLPGIVCPPVYECPQERCIHRQIVHEVPHV